MTDAPDGAHVVRVTFDGSAEEGYSIDDDPDTVASSVKGRSYSAVAWVKAPASTDRKPICIAIRERSGDDTSVGYAAGAMTAAAGAYRLVRVEHVAEEDSNTIDVFVFRPAPDLQDGEAFLVDAITMSEDSGGRAAGDC